MTTLPSTGAVRSFFLEGPAGRLEALLHTGALRATHAAVVCHPHPLYGGTMHNKVVFSLTKVLNGFGFPVLRFNFRGTGLSAGEHDFGRGEVADVRTALEWLYGEFRLPMIFAGFSFGAATGLKAACPDPRVAGLISAGTPLEVEDRAYGYGFFAGCTKPKLFVSGGRDQFAPREQLQRMVAAVPEPKQLVIIEGADHFFEGKLAELRAAVEAWTRNTFGI
ncbi:MAG: alpha/beta hydrolase [Terriglobales bacterium]